MQHPENGLVYVNLTEFAKPFPNKNLSQIINSLEIREYICALAEIQNYSSADLLIIRKGGDISQQGTWAHQKVALRVAQKLSPEFAVWVDTKIEELLRTGVATISNDDECIAHAMQVLTQRLKAARVEKEQLQVRNALQSEQLKICAPKVEYYEAVLQSRSTYNTNQIAKELGMSAETLNRKLRERGIQYKQNGTWLLTCKYQSRGYTKTKTHTYTRSDGAIATSMLTVWTEKGREFIINLFRNPENN